MSRMRPAMLVAGVALLALTGCGREYPAAPGSPPRTLTMIARGHQGPAPKLPLGAPTSSAVPRQPVSYYFADPCRLLPGTRLDALNAHLHVGTHPTRGTAGGPDTPNCVLRGANEASVALSKGETLASLRRAGNLGATVSIPAIHGLPAIQLSSPQVAALGRCAIFIDVAPNMAGGVQFFAGHDTLQFRSPCAAAREIAAAATAPLAGH